jgi:hypothetical protein
LPTKATQPDQIVLDVNDDDNLEYPLNKGETYYTAPYDRAQGKTDFYRQPCMCIEKVHFPNPTAGKSGTAACSEKKLSQNPYAVKMEVTGFAYKLCRFSHFKNSSVRKNIMTYLFTRDTKVSDETSSTKCLGPNCKEYGCNGYKLSARDTQKGKEMQFCTLDCMFAWMSTTKKVENWETWAKENNSTEEKDEIAAAKDAAQSVKAAEILD